MQIKQTQEFNLKDIILIASLPDMGKVGGIVSGYLAKKLTVSLRQLWLFQTSHELTKKME